MRNRRGWTQAAAAALVVAGFACAVASCDKDEDKVTCQSALRHFYDMGCIIVSGGDPVYDVNDAISGCAESASQAASVGCGAQYNSALECLAHVSYGACESCDYAFTAYNNCLLGPVCPGYSDTSTTCCRTSDPCDWASDGTCDCEGVCSWDYADCG